MEGQETSRDSGMTSQQQKDNEGRAPQQNQLQVHPPTSGAQQNQPQWHPMSPGGLSPMSPMSPMSPGGLAPDLRARLRRLKTLGQEEMQEFSQKTIPPIPMTLEEYQEVAKSMKNDSALWKTVGRGVSRWYVSTQDDDRARQFFRAWFHLKDQFWDKDQMTVPKGTFTLSCSQIDEFRPLFESIAKDLEQSGPARPVSFSQGLSRNNIQLQTHHGFLRTQDEQTHSIQQLASGLLTPQSAMSFWNDPLTPIAREPGYGDRAFSSLAISTSNQERHESDEKTPIAPAAGSQFKHT